MTEGTRDQIYSFALIGAAGYIAPRHLEAIRQTGNRLVAVTDPSDSVGILDRYGFEISYFREIERFDRFLDRKRRGHKAEAVDYVSICTPNYLHDAHIRIALRNECHAVCEKPLVINPWNLDALADLERESGRRVFNVLQLRLHPDLVALKRRLERTASGSGPVATTGGEVEGGTAAQGPEHVHEVELAYVTGRGHWYDYSWKGQEERSGGISVNIGIHFFDLLIWLFGDPLEVRVHLREPRRMAGVLRLQHARVRWLLSVDVEDVPMAVRNAGRTTYRCLRMDGVEVEFSDGFGDLHNEVYRRLLAGDGFGIADARPSIDLTYRIRTEALESDGEELRAILDATVGEGATV